MQTRKMALLSLATAISALVAGNTAAQVYPSRPITMIVPYPPGGQADTIGRILARQMRTTLGQPVIIENIGGASGSIGIGHLARAAADGYTLGLGSFSTFVLNGAAYKLKYDLLNDFEPVALLPAHAHLIVARKTMQASTLKDLIGWLKTNPDKASQGTSGIGAASHLAGIVFQKESGTRFQFVTYRGTAMSDLVAGHVDLMIDTAANSLPQVRAGTIKAYAVTSKSRLAVAPDIATVDEAGLPGFYMSLWNGFWVPKGTPKSVIAMLNSATVTALADPDVRRRPTDLGLEIFPREQQTPDALRAFHRAEIQKWWPIVEAAKTKAQ